MGRPVVHFEIIGTAPAALRDYYGALFAWEFSTGDATTDKVSQPGTTTSSTGRPPATAPASTAVSAVAGARAAGAVLRGRARRRDRAAEAERLGGTRLLGPEPASGDFTVGRFADPEGNVVGVAGPSA
jgi:predicted enzyme related to lactoylglutathione lyase